MVKIFVSLFIVNIEQLGQLERRIRIQGTGRKEDQEQLIKSLKVIQI